MTKSAQRALRTAARARKLLLCRCGEAWDSEKHFTKTGKLRKNLAAGCVPTGRNGGFKRMLLEQARK